VLYVVAGAPGNKIEIARRLGALSPEPLDPAP
jgi:hypothetical protein